jgi:predicted O-linked N-acetylglucosamine transferase (SPINDLY family)
MNAHTDPNTLFQQAIAFHKEGRLDEAAAAYRQLLDIAPEHPVAAAYLGMLEFQRSHFPEAVQFLQASLALNPDQPEALSFLGSALQSLNRPEEALGAFDRALALRPDFMEVVVNRGLTLRGMGRAEQALASLDHAAAVLPHVAVLHNHRGLVLRDLGRHEESLAAFDRAVQLEPANHEALNNRALALQSLERTDEALASIEKAIGLRPDLATLHNNRGNALLHYRRFEEALGSYEEALRLDPAYADAHMNKGNALLALGRQDAALASYDRAIALAPNFAEAWLAKGSALLKVRDKDGALAHFDRAIALKPAYAQAHVNRGHLLRESKRLDEALASYTRALEADPQVEFARGLRLYTRMQLCDWTAHQDETSAIEASIARGEKVADPFQVLSMTGSAALRKRTAEIYARARFPASDALPVIPLRARRDKIRLGYFSADFRSHPVSLLAAELFEMHDRTRFEVIAFSLDPDGGDAFTVRLITAFDQFIDVRDQTDREIAELARALEIDIAIDLGGYTQNSRTGIFALRPAPVAVNFLGYSSTMGVDYIDYMIADGIVIPEAARQHYTEKIASLPNCYLPNDSTRRIAKRNFSRSELGLPEKGFVFCSFNNSYKINPAMFDIWMRLLQRVEGSVLWLSRFSETAMRNLREEAVKRGVSADRIVFTQFMQSPEDHLARIRSADLFLDTLPYNAHTTASDALWAGLPLLTCAGEGMAGRAAASLLTALGLPELITHGLEEYEARAHELATQPAMLKEIRDKLARNRLTTPAFDMPSYIRHIESAYTAMHERHLTGQPPEHFGVRP